MVKAAVIQMCSGPEPQENLRAAEHLLQCAALQGAKLALLPENFAALDSPELAEFAKKEAETGRIKKQLQHWAQEWDLWIVAGTLPQPANDTGERLYSSSLVFDNRGNEVARYDKIHLFDVTVADAHSCYRESDYIVPGSELEAVTSPYGALGLSVCYDLRFPEQYQRLKAMGAEIMTVPSAFTTVTGEAHWELLLRARAVETQSYVLAANQSGQHSETRSSWGHSMIIDPWGKVLAEVGDRDEGVAIAELDLDYMQKCRAAMPLDQHRAKAGF